MFAKDGLAKKVDCAAETGAGEGSAALAKSPKSMRMIRSLFVEAMLFAEAVRTHHCLLLLALEKASSLRRGL